MAKHIADEPLPAASGLTQASEELQSAVKRMQPGGPFPAARRDGPFPVARLDERVFAETKAIVGEADRLEREAYDCGYTAAVEECELRRVALHYACQFSDTIDPEGVVKVAKLFEAYLSQRVLLPPVEAMAEAQRARGLRAGGPTHD